MVWLVWSNGTEYGCCKSWDESYKAISALIENGFEVWEIDLSDLDTGKFPNLNLNQLEKWAILKALDLRDWSQTEAADLLGISARVINHKIVKHGIIHTESGNGKSTWSKNI